MIKVKDLQKVEKQILIRQVIILLILIYAQSTSFVTDQAIWVSFYGLLSVLWLLWTEHIISVIASKRK